MYVSVHKLEEHFLTSVKQPCTCVNSEKKPPDYAVGGLCPCQGRAVYIVSMKLRSRAVRRIRCADRTWVLRSDRASAGSARET